MMLRFKGTYDWRDFVKAQALVLKRMRWLLTTILAIDVLGLLVLYGPILEGDEWRYFVTAFVIFVIFMTHPWWAPYLQALLLQHRTRVFGSEMTVEVDEQGVTYILPHQQSRQEWAAFKRYRANNQILLLYQKAGGVCHIPRSIIPSDSAWVDLISMVSQKLPTK
jgi:hypothetical protein